MGQPNLSKSIRELEASLHYTVRAHGPAVWRPPKTADFLGYASQHHRADGSLETMFGPPYRDRNVALCLCAACQLCCAGVQPVPCGGRASLLQVQYRETSAAAVISDVASGTANLGVVRWQAEHAATLDNLLRENALSGEVLWEFSMVVLLRLNAIPAALGISPPPAGRLSRDRPRRPYARPARRTARAGAVSRQGRIAAFDRWRPV